MGAWKEFAIAVEAASQELHEYFKRNGTDDDGPLQQALNGLRQCQTEMEIDLFMVDYADDPKRRAQKLARRSIEQWLWYAGVRANMKNRILKIIGKCNTSELVQIAKDHDEMYHEDIKHQQTEDARFGHLI